MSNKITRPALSEDATVYFDGRWQKGTGETVTVTNPSTGEVLMVFSAAGNEQVAGAVKAAQSTRRRYARMLASERATLVHRVADVLRANAEDLAALIAAEVGKPMREARGEVASAAAYADYMADWALRIEGEILPADSTNEALLLLREPMGVVAAITAWNYPLDLLLRKLAPALVTGNCVVVKPTEVTPLSAIVAFRAIVEAIPELSSGVLGLVPGGRTTGEALVGDRGINMITMTGHRNSGKAIMAAASANLTRVALELGGHAPALVCADADLDAAIQALVEARFANAGQVCTSAERILVDRAVYQEFIERFVAASEELTVGRPEEDHSMGPLVNAAQLDKVRSAVGTALAEGARMVAGQSKALPQNGGYWCAPTVLTDMRPNMTMMREETFGPVAAIMPFENFGEAMDIANDTPYGLSAFVFTNDYRRAHLASRDLEFGEVYVNRTMGEALQGFHSGHKESGLGGEDGKHGVLKFTQIKSVYHHFG